MRLRREGRSRALSAPAQSVEFLYSVGETPAMRRKDLLNWDKDWKPTSNAISEILSLGFSSRIFVFSIRTRAT